MEPHRIALLIHALHGGGAERLMSNLATRWSNQFHVDLITWAAIDTDVYEVPPSVHRHGLDLTRPSRSTLHGLFANLQRVRRLRQKLRELQPEFTLSFSDQMNIVALQAARNLQTPIWISEHSDPAKQELSSLWERWRRSIYPSCTGCIVLTESIAEWMSQLVPRERIRVIPASIQAAATSLPTPASEPDVARRPRQALYLGRLSAEKNLPLLIEAWKRARLQLPDWRLRIVGDGDQRSELEACAADCESIQFDGWTNEPESYLGATDLFLLSSNYEGFPVALLEAMNHGIACVATECSSAIELLARTSDDKPALLTVPVGSAPALAETIIKLAGDTELRRALGNAARSRAKDYHWSAIGPLWDAILPPHWQRKHA